MKMRDEDTKSASGDWEAATWEGSRQAHLKAMLAATPAQRLAWLEEAIRLAHETGALQRLREAEARELMSKFGKAGLPEEEPS